MDLSICMFYEAYLARFRTACMMALCEIDKRKPFILNQAF